MSRYGNPTTRKSAQQTWVVGAVVTVGFQKGLTILGKTANGDWHLRSASGKEFQFAPHLGLFAI